MPYFLTLKDFMVFVSWSETKLTKEKVWGDMEKRGKKSIDPMKTTKVRIGLKKASR